MDLELMTDRKGEDCETPVATHYSHEEKARMGIKEAFIAGYLVGHRMASLKQYDSEGAYNEWNNENVRPRG